MESWVTIAQSLGVATACLMALGLAVWRIAKWLGMNVILPIRDGHLAFVDSVSKAVRNQSKSLESVAEAISAISASRTDELDRLVDIAAKLEKIGDKMDKQINQLVVKTGSVVVVPPAQTGGGHDPGSGR